MKFFRLIWNITLILTTLFFILQSLTISKMGIKLSQLHKVKIVPAVQQCGLAMFFQATYQTTFIIKLISFLNKSQTLPNWLYTLSMSQKKKKLVTTQPSALQQPFHKKTSRLFKKDRHLKVVCNAFSSQAGAFFFFYKTFDTCNGSSW